MQFVFCDPLAGKEGSTWPYYFPYGTVVRQCVYVNHDNTMYNATAEKSTKWFHTTHIMSRGKRRSIPTAWMSTGTMYYTRQPKWRAHTYLSCCPHITEQLQPRQHRHTLRTIRGTVGILQGVLWYSSTFHSYVPVQTAVGLRARVWHIFSRVFVCLLLFLLSRSYLVVYIACVMHSYPVRWQFTLPTRYELLIAIGS